MKYIEKINEKQQSSLQGQSLIYKYAIENLTLLMVNYYIKFNQFI